MRQHRHVSDAADPSRTEAATEIELGRVSRPCGDNSKTTCSCYVGDLAVATHRLLSSSFLGLPYRILNMNNKKELLRSLSVLQHPDHMDLTAVKAFAPWEPCGSRPQAQLGSFRNPGVPYFGVLTIRIYKDPTT